MTEPTPSQCRDAPDLEPRGRVQRASWAVVLDTSGSMRGMAISRLNAALRGLERDLNGDPAAHGRAEFLIIRAGGFGRPEVVRDWTDALDFRAPALEAHGVAPLGSAMSLALDRVAKRCARHAQCGLDFDRPRIVLVADGVPEDEGWESAAERCREAEREGRVEILALGTSEADFEALARFGHHAPRRLSGLRFEAFFAWIARSIGAAELPPTCGWTLDP